MPSRFLTDEQRARYGRYAGGPSEEQLARYFHLDATDRERVNEMRGAHNRIGFAIQLGTARFLGTFLDDPTQTPSAVIATVARQLGVVPAPSLDAYRDGRQRWRHIAMIRERYGFRDLEEDASACFRLTRWLYVLCRTGDDRPGLLFDRATRLAGDAQGAASRRHHTGAPDRPCAPPRQSAALASSDGHLDRRAAPEALGAAHARRHDARSPGGPARHTEAAFADGTVAAPGTHRRHLLPWPESDEPANLPSAPLSRLARMARTSKPSNLAVLQEPRRTATLVALFQTLEAVALDDAVELFDALATDIFSAAEEAHRKSRLRSLRDLDAAAIVLRDVSRRVIQDDDLPLTSWRDALIDILVSAPDDRRYQELRPYWRRVRTLFSGLLQRITLDATPAGRPVTAALNYLRGVDNWSKARMTDAPTEVVGAAWKRHALDDAGRVTDSCAYVFATLDAFRTGLKRRDVFVPAGVRYADPRRGLLSGEAWNAARLTVCRSLDRSPDATAVLGDLTARLDRAYHQVAANFPSNPAARIERRGDALVLSPLDKIERPASLIALQSAVAGRLPRVDLPDILLEVAARSGFTDSFTHVSERHARVEEFTTSLCGALIAQACNIGFEPMIRTDQPALSRARLSWVSQNFIRPETITAANACLVAAQNALPIAHTWGSGDVASANGIRFVAPSSAIHAGPNPKYFGAGRGITYYNLVSDQFTG
jgi:hypothetical protein